MYLLRMLQDADQAAEFSSEPIDMFVAMVLCCAYRLL